MPKIDKWKNYCEKKNLCPQHGNPKEYCEDCFGIIMSGNFQSQIQETYNKGISQGWKDGYADGLSDGRREALTPKNNHSFPKSR